MSTYDNLLAVVQLTIKKPEKQRSMVEQLLTEFNLQHLRNINANSLSGGEVRRLQIARTLVNNPKVIYNTFAKRQAGWIMTGSLVGFFIFKTSKK